MIILKGINVVFNQGTVLANHVLKSLDLQVKEGDFVTVIGGNGAGKSTLMNLLAGNVFPKSGQVLIDDLDVTFSSAEKRALYIARVFQDPMIGTCADLTIEENLALAYKRGRSRGFNIALNHNLREKFRATLAELNIGLEDRLNDEVGLLSGGQRQVLSLIMATLMPSKILLLDEHTAALDPKMSEIVMQLTDKLYKQQNLTILMITHNIKHAFKYGNRTVMLQEGKVSFDLQGDERNNFDPIKLLDAY